MSFQPPFPELLPGGALGAYLSSALPDFLLAFAFFTAVAFAVLSRRFQAHRATVAMSGALGMALALGLVWWEQANDYSIRNLGPIAVGIALILLAMVVHQAVKQIGGSWAGAGIAIGASLLIGKVLAASFPVDWQVLQTLATVSLILGVLAFFAHRHGGMTLSRDISRPPIASRHEFFNDRNISKRLLRGFRHLRNEAQQDNRSSSRGREDRRPQDLQDIARQIQRMLPAEGWLTQRLAALREKIHYIRNGELERVEDIAHLIRRLPPETRAAALERMKEHYRESRLLEKLDQLDKAVAVNETRIMSLTHQAKGYADTHEHQALLNTLVMAEKLQKQNSRLFQWMDQLDHTIESIARKATPAPGPGTGSTGQNGGHANSKRGEP